jgi:hypothetical protein
MKLISNNVTIIVNDEMDLALVQIRDKNIFMKHKELLKVGEILNEFDFREELRDLINDYVTQIKN